MSARLRMFAGPNGSGKSTIKEEIRLINPHWLGIYINPDDIEKEINESGSLNFDHFSVKTSKRQIIGFLRTADQLIDNGLTSEITKLHFASNSLTFHGVELNSYLVSAIADFLHEQLIASHMSFSFETVMSHPRKLEVLKSAVANGFRNYLYFVATEDPQINISRVKTRVKQGGHDVPKHKIISRYYRTLNNLVAAVYDNSGTKATLIAEITDGKVIEIKNSSIPVWVSKYFLEKAG